MTRILLSMMLFATATVLGAEGFLERDGTRLRLNGADFREVSFNKFDLFQQFVLPGKDHRGADGQEAAVASLRELSEHGFRTIRVNASPFYPAWFEESFFDADPEQQRQKRETFFTRFDDMLDTCDSYGISIVATLIWNVENVADLGHHSLEEGFRSADSLGRRRLDEYVREVVTRYRDRPTIALWELCNEWNLGADLQFPKGILSGSAEGDALHPGPVVRDARNNYTSDELAAFFQETAAEIRALDANHLITTGTSAPRPAATHLLRAAREKKPLDWTLDTEDELTEYLRLLHPDPLDVLSIHYYDDGMTALGRPLGDPANLRMFRRIAERLGKPLFIGEIGLHEGLKRYDTETSLSLLDKTLSAWAETDIPLVLYWTFRDDRSWANGEYSLRYGQTDAALERIERANRR